MSIPTKRPKLSVEAWGTIIIVLLLVTYAAICILWRFFAPCWTYAGHSALETPNRCLNTRGVVQ